MNNIIEDAIKKYDYAFAIWTDSADFIIDKGADIRFDHLLEIRCFDKNGEFHALRGTIDSDFSYREITDDNEYADGFFDEAQYLDIDTVKTTEKGDGYIYTIGGGRYSLPADVKDKKMILVRNYYKFDEDGIARKYDWRLVGFTNEETVGKENDNGNTNS